MIWGVLGLVFACSGLLYVIYRVGRAQERLSSAEDFIRDKAEREKHDKEIDDMAADSLGKLRKFLRKS